MTLDLTHHDGSQAGPLLTEPTLPEAAVEAAIEAEAEEPPAEAEGILSRAKNLAALLAHTLEEPFAATSTMAKHELMLAHSLACHVVDILTSLSAEPVRLSRADAE